MKEEEMRESEPEGKTELKMNEIELGKLNHYLLNLNPFPSPIQLGLNYIFSFTFLNCKQGVSRICSFFLLFNWTVTKEINHYEIRNLSNSVKGPRISCFPVELLTLSRTWLKR